MPCAARALVARHDTSRAVEPGLGDGLDRACARARQALCRMAAGARFAAAALARHARRCPSCRDRADDLARVQRLLRCAAQHPSPTPPAVRHLEQQAQRAVARELRARLARDLLAMGTGAAPRPVRERRLDVLRLEALDAALSPCLMAALAQAEGPGRGLRALDLAARLDPCGLDIALSRLAALSRTGRPADAQRETDRLLARLPGRQPEGAGP